MNKVESTYRWRLLAFAVSALCVSEWASAQVPPNWSEPRKPFKVFANSYYVGTAGLSAVLVTSTEGHVLIDGTVPEGAKIIADNIRALGFKVDDIKLILNTHVHFDHAGGIAELQQLSGARVAASGASAKVLLSGDVDRDDPQFGGLPKIAKVKDVRVIKDGETLQVGALALTAHFTPGHTPGGTTWTWKSCEGTRCLNMVYADSLNPISAPGYLYTDSKRKPNGKQLLERSADVVSALPCDILLAPHPELVDTFGKLAKGERGENDSFVDSAACKAYAQASRERLKNRVTEEQSR